MFRWWPLLQHVLVIVGFSLMCFWVAMQKQPPNNTFLCIGLLGCFVGTALMEAGGRLRQYEDRIRKLEGELARRSQFVP